MLLSLWGRVSVVQPAWGPEPGPFSQALHWLALCLPSHFVGSRTIFPPLGPASSSTSSAYSGEGAAMGVLHPGPGGRRVGWPGPQEGACLEFLEVAGAWKKAWTSSASTKGLCVTILGRSWRRPCMIPLTPPPDRSAGRGPAKQARWLSDVCASDNQGCRIKHMC